MSGIAPGPDPSMEDILASIRRILDEDQAAPAAPVVDAPPAGAPHGRTPADDEAEFVLEESMLETPDAVAAPEPPAFEGPIHQPRDLEPQAPAETAMPPALPMPPAPEPVLPTPIDTDPVPMSADTDASGRAASEPGDAPSLLGAQAAQVTASSMMSLVRAVTADRGSMVRSTGPSIEDVVREELRPLLKEWLESHLPPLVERLVRAEIERVVSRATF